MNRLFEEYSMQIRSVVVAAALGLASVAHGQQAVQWRVEDGGNGHWYRLKTTSAGITWTQASLEAQGSGVHLATLTSEPEQSFVAGYLLSIPGHGESAVRRWGPWIGARQFPTPRSPEPHGGWTWVTQEEWDFEFWWSGNPNNQCSETGQEENFLSVGGWYVGGGGVWNDLPEIGCDNDPVVSALLEWSADCNDDGIVDYGQCSDGSLPDYDGNNVPDCCEAGVPCTVGNYPIQWRVDDGGNGHWYQGVRSDSLVNRVAASTAASLRGGSLVGISTALESTWVFETIAKRPEFWQISAPFAIGPWIGARKLGLNWTWDNGETWSHADWLPGEPNDTGESAHYYNSTFNPGGSLEIRNAWNDNWAFNVVAISYVLEWSADCDGNSIVDYGEILDGTLTDTNANGVPDCCDAGVSCDPCPGDLNGSNAVDAEDLAYVLFAWGTDGGKTPEADINRDGTVSANDLSVVLGSWGPCP